MYKLSTDLCYVNRCLRLRVCVIYKDKLNKEKISKTNFNGNDYLTIKTYPYLSLEISNETERKETWNYQKTINLDRFGMFKFVDSTKPLIESFTKEKGLFFYDMNKRLHVNKELANKNSITISLSFSRSIWLSPIVVRDRDSNIEMEGIVMCFDSIANYVTLTYDEFRFLVDYVEKLDLESIGLQLITFAEVTKNKSFTKIDELVTEQIPESSNKPKDSITGIGPVKKEENLPKI